MNRATRKSATASNSARVEAHHDFSKGQHSSSGTIRVLLADDHPVVRWGLSSCLSRHQRMVVIGEASTGIEAVHKAKQLSPDVVLMDIDMPEMNGLTATELLRRENPGIKVLLVSTHPYTWHTSRIVGSGARGFILKDTRPAEIIAAICKIAAGETCFSPEVARKALNQFARCQGAELEGKALSRREREVLIGIAEGLSNKEIARRLGVGDRTVETHRGHLMQKLGIHTVAGLTRHAVSEGLVVLSQHSNPP